MPSSSVVARGSVLASAGPSLGASVLDAVRRHPDRPALVIDEEVITYSELGTRIGRIAACLRTAKNTSPRLGAVFGARTFAAYEGILGTLVSGAGYVPLNPKFPDARNAYMLASSGASSLVLDAEGIPRLAGLLASVEKPLLIVTPHVEDVTELAKSFPLHTFIDKNALSKLAPITDPPAVDLDDIAYLLFTSGTTGTPKGVMVDHRNVLHQLSTTCDYYGIGENDRVSQTFDLTFDVSVFDMFTTLTRGASLHVLPAKALLAPDKFIKSHELTIWFSVPSVAMMMRSFNRLQPGVFPSLRFSLFAGERLSAEIATAWQAAAPQSHVENLYGPTEVTVACTRYRWRGSPGESAEGGVPIGAPYPGMTAAVVDDQFQPVKPGERGELCMRGPLVTPGYWLDDAKTNERYVAMPWLSGPSNRWYRTGDIAYLREDGQLVHCGRNDDQIKLHGFRIELGEIERVLVAIALTDFVTVVAYPSNEDGPQGLVAAIARTSLTNATILKAAREKLPAYMIPDRILQLDEMPLNANGKMDKKRIVEMLRAEDAAADA